MNIPNNGEIFLGVGVNNSIAKWKMENDHWWLLDPLTGNWQCMENGPKDIWRQEDGLGNIADVLWRE